MKARAAEEEVFAASSTSFTVEAVQQAQPIAEIAAQSCCAPQADTAAAAGLPGIPPAGLTALLVRQGWADEPGCVLCLLLVICPARRILNMPWCAPDSPYDDAFLTVP